ncbi:MAG: PorT family protein [Bacteroidetes bacterium]|nr:PorT family protein [Bacteroidota bacterium]
MKHWLNNWEKVIGKRLSNAEAVPDSHVWTRIERELDAELIADRNRGIKRTAGILLLLLLMTSTYLITNQPRSERAMAGYLLELNDIDNSGIRAYQTVVPTSPVFPTTVVETKIVVAALMQEEVDELISDPVVAEVLIQKEVEEERLVLELAEIEDDNFNFEVPLRTFSNTPVKAYYQMAGLNGRAGGVALNNNVTTSELQTTEHRSRTGKRELMSRIAASSMVTSPLLVWSQRPDLNVSTQSQRLDVNHTYVETSSFELRNEEFVSAHISMIEASPAETALEAEMKDTDLETGEETALVTTEKEVLSEVVAMEQKVNWMAGAMEELEVWKELMEENSATEKEELEELIEEAVIEEEDPLTRKQNEAMDLYRSYNVNKGFHIGLITGIQNTWVTKETRNPEIDRSLVNTKLAPGYQVGINMGYDITDHFGLMMELKYSDEGGRYYNPAKDRIEHLDLKYFEVPIYAKVKHSKMTQKLRPIVFNYLVGFSYSDLRKMSATIDGSIDQRFGQDYNTTQWGLSAGFDFDFYVHKNFFWTIGTRAGVSGDSKAFPKFKGADGNSAITIDAGIYTRFSFRLPGR